MSDNKYTLHFNVTGGEKAVKSFNSLIASMKKMETVADFRGYAQGMQTVSTKTDLAARTFSNMAKSAANASKVVQKSSDEVVKSTEKVTKARKETAKADTEAAKAAEKAAKAAENQAKTRKKQAEAAEKASKATKQQAKDLKEAVNVLRDITKNVDFQHFSKSMGNFNSGAKFTVREVSNLSKQMDKYYKTMMKVGGSPEMKEAYKVIFGSEAANSGKSLTQMYNDMQGRLQAYREDLKKTAKTEKEYQVGSQNRKAAVSGITYKQSLDVLKKTKDPSREYETSLKRSVTHLKRMQTAYRAIQNVRDNGARSLLMRDFERENGRAAASAAESGKLRAQFQQAAKELQRVSQVMRTQREASNQMQASLKGLSAVEKNVRFKQFRESLDATKIASNQSIASLRSQRKEIEKLEAAVNSVRSGSKSDKLAFGQKQGSNALRNLNQLPSQLSQATKAIDQQVAKLERNKLLAIEGRSNQAAANNLTGIERGNRLYREREKVLSNASKMDKATMSQLQKMNRELSNTVGHYNAIQKFSGKAGYDKLMDSFKAKYGDSVIKDIVNGKVSSRLAEITQHIGKLDARQAASAKNTQVSASKSAREFVKYQTNVEAANRSFAKLQQTVTSAASTPNSQLLRSAERLNRMRDEYQNMQSFRGDREAYRGLRRDYVGRYGTDGYRQAAKGGVDQSLGQLTNQIAKNMGTSNNHAYNLVQRLGQVSNASNNIHQVWRGMAAASGNIWLSWGNFAPMLAGLVATGSVLKSLNLERELGWQMEMVGVAADTGAENVSNLREQVLELGTSGIVQGPLQLANALRILTQAGLSTQEAFSALKPVTNLALVAEISDDQAAKFLAGAKTAFNLEREQVDDSGRVTKVLDEASFQAAADQTAKAAAVSQTSIERMMEALRQASSEAEKYNLTVTDTSTVLAMLARYNIEGSTAGTSLRNFLVDMTGRTPRARKALEELGLTIYNAQGEVRPFTDIVADLQSKLGDLSSQDKQMWLRKIFNERGMKTANVLLSMTTAEMMQLHNQISRSSENMGYTANSAQRLANTSQGAFLKMKNGWEGMMAVVGGRLSDPFQSLMGQFTELSRSQDVAQGIESIGNALIGVASALGSVSSLVLENSQLFLTLGGAIGGMGLVLTAKAVPAAYALAKGLVTARLAALGLVATPLGPWLLGGAAIFGTLAYVLSDTEERFTSFKESLQNLPAELGSVSTDIYEAFNKESGGGGSIDVKLGIGLDEKRMAELGNDMVKFKLKAAKDAQDFAYNLEQIGLAVAETSKELNGGMVDNWAKTSKEETALHISARVRMTEQNVMYKDRQISLLKDELSKFDAHYSGVEKLSEEQRNVRMQFERDIHNLTIELMNERTKLMREQLMEMQTLAVQGMSNFEVFAKSIVPVGENSELASRGQELLDYSKAKAFGETDSFQPKYATIDELERGLKLYRNDFSQNWDTKKAAEAMASVIGRETTKSYDPSQAFKAWQADATETREALKTYIESDASKNIPQARIQMASLEFMAKQLEAQKSEDAPKARQMVSELWGIINQSENTYSSHLNKSLTTVKAAVGTGGSLSDREGVEYEAPNVTNTVSYESPYASKFNEYAKEYAKDATEKLKSDFERQKAIFGTVSEEAVEKYLQAFDVEASAANEERIEKIRNTMNDLQRGILNGDFVGDSLVRANQDLAKMQELLLSEHAKGVVKTTSIVRKETANIRDVNKLDSGDRQPLIGSKETVVPNGAKLSGNSKYAMPYQGTYRITSKVGNRKSPGGVGSTNHKGIDIAMPIGTPVYAQTDGVVTAGFQQTVKNGKKKGAGNYVYIKNAEGLRFGSFHLDSKSVKSGDSVKKGQLIGYSGNTGGSTGPHLHQQVDKNGKYLDPLELAKGNVSHETSKGTGQTSGNYEVKAKGRKGQTQELTTEFQNTANNETDGEMYIQRQKTLAELRSQEIAKVQALWKLQGKVVQLEGEKLQWSASSIQLDEHALDRAHERLNLENEFGFVSKDRLEAETMNYEKLKLQIEEKKALLEIDSNIGLTENERLAISQKISFEFANQNAALEEQQRLMGKSKEAYSGFVRALNEYTNQPASMGDAVYESTKMGLDRTSDLIADFIATGEMDFRSFTVSILQDLSKLWTKMALVNFTKGVFNEDGSFNSSGNFLGNFMGGLFGGSKESFSGGQNWAKPLEGSEKYFGSEMVTNLGSILGIDGGGDSGFLGKFFTGLNSESGFLGEFDSILGNSGGGGFLGSFGGIMSQMISALAPGALGGGGGGGGLWGTVASFASSIFANEVGGAYGNGVKYFAKGGTFTNSVVDSPTMFKSGGILGVMGEAGPEAILPLTRTSSGNLGVETTGVGAGNSHNTSVVVNVTVNSDGSSSENFSLSDADAKELGRMISAKALEVVVREVRPGGVIHKTKGK